MEPKHYTNPLLRWAFRKDDSNSEHDIAELVYDLTGMNFYHFEPNPIIIPIVAILTSLCIFVGGLLSSVPNNIMSFFNISNVNNMMAFLMLPVIIRVFYPPTPHRLYSGSWSYMDELINFEQRKYGKQVTHTWFLYLWYIILRVGRWSSVRFWLGSAIQIGALIGLLTIQVKSAASIMLILVGVSVYMFMVYRNEFEISS